MKWIDVKKRLPRYIKGKDYSENVLAICDGRLCVMTRCYDPGAEGWIWGSCYGDINGDPETDDEYNVTHWMPLPKPPQPLSGTTPASQANDVVDSGVESNKDLI